MYVMDKHIVREMRIAIALGIGIGLMLALNFGIAWYLGATIGGVVGMFAYRPKEAWSIVRSVAKIKWNLNMSPPAQRDLKVFVRRVSIAMFTTGYALSLVGVFIISTGFCEFMKVYGMFPSTENRVKEVEVVSLLTCATFTMAIIQGGLYCDRKTSLYAWVFPMSRLFGVIPALLINRLSEWEERKGGFLWLLAPFFLVLTPVIVVLFAVMLVIAVLDIAVSVILALAGNERLTVFAGVFLGTAIGCLVYRTANLPPVVIIPGMMMLGGYYGPLLYLVRQKLVLFFHSAKQLAFLAPLVRS